MRLAALLSILSLAFQAQALIPHNDSEPHARLSHSRRSTISSRACTRHSQCANRTRPQYSNYVCQTDGTCGVSLEILLEWL